MKESRLLTDELQVINMGLKSFADNLRKENTAVVAMNWIPRANGNPEMAELLRRYYILLKKA